MRFESNRIPAFAMSLFFVAAQVYLGVTFAERASVTTGETVPVMPQQAEGILTTVGDEQITLNRIAAISGATIVSGASIETPAGVSSRVGLVGRGAIDIEPETKLTLEFDQSHFKVTLTEGCINLHTEVGVTGEFITPNGTTTKTGPAQGGKLESCQGRAVAPIKAPDNRPTGLFRLGAAAAFAVIAEGEKAIAVPVAPRGVLY